MDQILQIYFFWTQVSGIKEQHLYAYKKLSFDNIIPRLLFVFLTEAEKLAENVLR